MATSTRGWLKRVFLGQRADKHRRKRAWETEELE